MSIVIDTLHNSAITEELNIAEVKILAGLFEVDEYKAGEVISSHADKKDNLYILAQGEIEVKTQSGNAENTIHVLKPGDLAGIITFVGGAATQHSATLYALGDTKVLTLERNKFETLLNSHPMIVYKVMRGIVRNVHSIVRHMNAQSSEMSNYIFRTHGRY
ncbi:MAG: cyclic nucleotide-binding domain-containing protein [Gallionella sp.]|nr:cyclic nucleotide-binding domain-containing protein [Gallionella sp.]MDH4285804.1 cyclic nucleotide-binding domain-containing protein [Gallionella sp.]